MSSTHTRATKKAPATNKTNNYPFPIVAIGASAGGIEAISELLKNLPPKTGMAFIYVQHLSPDHKSMLTEILSKKTSMKVQEIDNMDKIQPDNVFVIPHNKVIKVWDGHIKLLPRTGNSSATSVDLFFTSLAKAQKERVIGIILSGSASDGRQGIKAIKQEGGLTFAQDHTAKFESMPQAAIGTGAVDFILSPKEMALELARLSKHPLLKTNEKKAGKESLMDNNSPDLKVILQHLYKFTGVDFSSYKMNTIRRRTIRRMLLHKIKSLKEYANFLSRNSEETDILYQDLLINVTSFFRDSEAHKYLKNTLFPKILKAKNHKEPLRIWVPACSTGEEAYSLAMMLIEIQETRNNKVPVQIFASDLSAFAIGKARSGMYSKHDLETLSPKRIQRFFTKADGAYRIAKAVRDICVFAPHNVLQDPPFSKLDFISCCNLFIYLDTPAQKKVLATFHYALNDNGYLMLGKSENVSSSSQLFSEYNKKYKIFSRKQNSGARILPSVSSRLSSRQLPLITTPENKKSSPFLTKIKTPATDRSLENIVDAVLVSEFMPSSVIINHEMEVMQLRGSTDLYLTHAPGKATLNILKMARPEISFELRTIISKAIKTKHRTRKKGIEIKIDGTMRFISIEVVPLKIKWDEPLLLILFTEQEQLKIYGQPEKAEKGTVRKDRKIKMLEEDLAAAHMEAIALAQGQEAFTQELQSINEEVVSSNEELQTVNEELETSKEEIESANEELMSINQELQTRNDLLNESYEYSEAIVSTMHDSMIILDKDLRVKTANKAFYKRFGFTEEDIIGKRLYDLGNRQWNIPKLRELLEDIIPRNSELEDFEVSHTFLNKNKKIMLLNASRIIQKIQHEELILLAIHDITETRKLIAQKELAEEQLLAEAIIDRKAEKAQLEKEIAERTKELHSAKDTIVKNEDRYQQMVNEVQDYAIFSLNKEGVIESWNIGAEKIKGYKASEIIGKNFRIFYTKEDLEKKLPEKLLNQAIKTGKATHEGWRTRKDGSIFWGNIVITALHDSKNNIFGFSKVTRDLTSKKASEDRIKEANEMLLQKNNELQTMNKELEAFAYVSSHDLQEPLRKIQTLSGLILEKENKNLSENGKKYFLFMRNSAKRMQTLIQDLLTFSRLNTVTEKEFEKVSLRAIVNEAKVEYKDSIAEKKAKIEVKEICEVRITPFQFRQLIFNLISNALKFSDPKRPPHIIITSKKEKAGTLRVANLARDKAYCHISISDNGIGIEQKFTEKIFEVFQRLHGREEYPGTGIGLAIVKKIVENHSGMITATSKVNQGTTFNIYIPAHEK